MPTTTAARIANVSLFCEAHLAMDKIIEQLLAMADEGATADAVSQLLAKDGTALLRDLMQGYFDRRAEQERRVKVVGADGIERSEVRTASRRIETPVGEIEVKRLLYQAPGVEGIAPLDAALGLPDEKYTHDVRRIVAEESAKSSFDEVVELIAKRTGAHVPTLESPPARWCHADSQAPPRPDARSCCPALDAAASESDRARWRLVRSTSRSRVAQVDRARVSRGPPRPRALACSEEFVPPPADGRSLPSRARTRLFDIGR